MLTMADGSNIKISFARFLVNNMALNPFIYQTLFSKVRGIKLLISRDFELHQKYLKYFKMSIIQIFL